MGLVRESSTDSQAALSYGADGRVRIEGGFTVTITLIDI